MASVTITIPDALVPRVRAAARGQYPEFAALSDANAFRAITSKLWREVIATWEGAAAAEAAWPGYQNAYDVAASQARADMAGIT